MKCEHPDCTGTHSNHKGANLCPAAADKKRARDNWYYSTPKGLLNRARKTMPATMYAEFEAAVNSEWMDELTAMPVEDMISATFRRDIEPVLDAYA